MDVWQGSEYASEVASNDVWISKVTDNHLLGKTKEQEPNEIENSWTKMLLNKTNSYIFKPCIAQSNIS